MVDGDVLLDFRAAAHFLAVSPATVRTWTSQRRLASVKVGRKTVRYRRRDLEAFLQAGERLVGSGESDAGDSR